MNELWMNEHMGGKRKEEGERQEGVKIWRLLECDERISHVRQT